jgi:hypothetical protein
MVEFVERSWKNGSRAVPNAPISCQDEGEKVLLKKKNGDRCKISECCTSKKSLFIHLGVAMGVIRSHNKL